MLKRTLLTVAALLIPSLCVAQTIAEHNQKQEIWSGDFTGAGQQTLAVRDGMFYLSDSPEPDTSRVASVGSVPPGIDPSNIYAGQFAFDGRTSLAAFDGSQQHWLSGRIGDAGQLTWQAAGNQQRFQLVEDGPVLFPPPPASKEPNSRSSVYSEHATMASVVMSSAWPVHATQRDHVQCGDVTTDLYLYSDGSIKGTMSLKGTCWLAGTHGSMIAILSDSSGHPLYSTSSLRLGVNPGQTVTVNLSDPKYNIRIPSALLKSGHGSLAIAQRYDPNDIGKILEEVAFWSLAGAVSAGAGGFIAWLIAIGIVILLF